MAYNTPPSRNTNDTVTAVIWNADVVANETFLAQPPACRATKSATQSTTGTGSGTSVAILFDTEDYDWSVTPMHDLVTNNSRILLPVAGVYIVGANVDFASNATGIRELLIKKNGTTVIATALRPSANTGTDPYSMSICFPYKFALNDYIEAWVRQSSGGALNINTLSPTQTAMHATWRSL